MVAEIEFDDFRSQDLPEIDVLLSPQSNLDRLGPLVADKARRLVAAGLPERELLSAPVFSNAERVYRLLADLVSAVRDGGLPEYIRRGHCSTHIVPGLTNADIVDRIAHAFSDIDTETTMLITGMTSEARRHAPHLSTYSDLKKNELEQTSFRFWRDRALETRDRMSQFIVACVDGIDPTCDVFHEARPRPGFKLRTSGAYSRLSPLLEREVPVFADRTASVEDGLILRFGHPDTNLSGHVRYFFGREDVAVHVDGEQVREGFAEGDGASFISRYIPHDFYKEIEELRYASRLVRPGFGLADRQETQVSIPFFDEETGFDGTLSFDAEAREYFASYRWSDRAESYEAYPEELDWLVSIAPERFSSLVEEASQDWRDGRRPLPA